MKKDNKLRNKSKGFQQLSKESMVKDSVLFNSTLKISNVNADSGLGNSMIDDLASLHSSLEQQTKGVTGINSSSGMDDNSPVFEFFDLVKENRCKFVKLTEIKVFYEDEEFDVNMETYRSMMDSRRGSIKPLPIESSAQYSHRKISAQIIKGFEFTYLKKKGRKGR